MAKIELKDYDGALLAIQSSCNLSRNIDCCESLSVLAKIYQYKNDIPSEIQALTNFLQQSRSNSNGNNGNNNNTIERKTNNNNKDKTRTNFQLQNEIRLAQVRLQKLNFLMKKQEQTNNN